MKGIVILSLIGVAALGLFMMAPRAGSEVESAYGSYIAEFSKSYTSESEYQMRLNIFSENVRRIEEINSQETNFQLGINQFSDMTNSEYRQMLGYRKASNVEEVESVDMSIPRAASIDWTAKGAVNKVQNQGSCGSCWAFGTIGAVEGAHFVKHKQLLKFAEQELVDCCHDQCAGCNGGFQNNAINWLSKHKLCLESDYTYTARDGTCQESKCANRSIEVSSYKILSKSAAGLESGLNQAPVSVTVDAGSFAFQQYSSGVLDSSSCGTQLNHAVLGTGYGHDSKLDVDYFTIRNSWGPSWGENGYIRVKKTSGSKGLCGIYMDNSYAIGK
jgi:C1A family cysteine protease